jgi:hypothetical protein
MSKDLKKYKHEWYEHHKSELIERHKTYYEAHKGEISAWQKAYKKANKDKIDAQNKAYCEANKEAIRVRDKAWWNDNKKENAARRRVRRYGITLETYNVLFAKQEGKCAICERHQSECKRAFAVDHDHDTGEVRGLLCSNCNTALGLLKDSPEITEKATQYLLSEAPCPSTR